MIRASAARSTSLTMSVGEDLVWTSARTWPKPSWRICAALWAATSATSSSEIRRGSVATSQFYRRRRVGWPAWSTSAPTPSPGRHAEMRRAMADAEVGDDVYGEDPTVNALEEEFAARLGKDAAIFVPSGTMANQLALRLLTRPGDLVVAGARQHIVAYEEGAAGRNAGVQFHLVADDDGTIRADDVRWALEAVAHHHPRVGLVCVENTHMPANGAPWSIEALGEVAAVAAAARLPVHMDGARLWHAEVATGTPSGRLRGDATTVMCCLSKGLCAPVGSLLAGPADVMDHGPCRAGPSRRRHAPGRDHRRSRAGGAPRHGRAAGR